MKIYKLWHEDILLYMEEAFILLPRLHE